MALKLFFGEGRFQPGILSPSPPLPHSSVLENETNASTGVWNLGRWSRPTNAIACGWWLLIAPALCFPAVRGADLTPLTINWTVVIYGGAMTLAMVYYAVSARKWFKGPKVNVDHILGAEGSDDQREGSDSLVKDAKGE